MPVEKLPGSAPVPSIVRVPGTDTETPPASPLETVEDEIDPASLIVMSCAVALTWPPLPLLPRPAVEKMPAPEPLIDKLPSIATATSRALPVARVADAIDPPFRIVSDPALTSMVPAFPELVAFASEKAPVFVPGVCVPSMVKAPGTVIETLPAFPAPEVLVLIVPEAPSDSEPATMSTVPPAPVLPAAAPLKMPELTPFGAVDDPSIVSAPPTLTMTFPAAPAPKVLLEI